MKSSLSIGEAAQYLGLSVDRVRRLENEGALKAKRTPGGHRRFKFAVLDSYRKQESQKPRPRSRQKVLPKPQRGAVQPVDPFLEDPDEWTEFELSDPDDRIGSERAKPTPIELVTEMLRRPDEKPIADETRRLQKIKNSGIAAIPLGTPAYWRAKVLRDLEGSVTAAEFPAGLPLDASVELVRGRVREVLEPYEKEKAVKAQKAEDERRKAAAERQEAEDRQRIQELVAYGQFHGQLETLLWNQEDREDAREEIEEVLQKRVGSDGRKDDVKELVDDILDQYEDDEE